MSESAITEKFSDVMRSYFENITGPEQREKLYTLYDIDGSIALLSCLTDDLKKCQSEEEKIAYLVDACNSCEKLASNLRDMIEEARLKYTFNSDDLWDQVDSMKKHRRVLKKNLNKTVSRIKWLELLIEEIED